MYEAILQPACRTIDSGCVGGCGKHAKSISKDAEVNPNCPITYIKRRNIKNRPVALHSAVMHKRTSIFYYMYNYSVLQPGVVAVATLVLTY